MLYANLTAVLQRLTRRRDEPSHDLLSPIQVRRLLDVERVRSDRTGESLSLVVFTPRTDDAIDATTALLAQSLRTRLRITDHAGFLDDGIICAVLPFTPAAGAWKVADDLCLLFPENVPPPICTVYSYPSGTLPIPNVGAVSDGSGRFNSTPSERTPRPNLTDTPLPAPTGKSLATRPATASLGPMFLRPASAWKRLADIVGATFGLVVLLPMFPFIAMAIKFSSHGPIFFKQQRAGWGGRPFSMWKFRTMVADAEARKAELMAKNEQDGPAFKIKHDPRVTRVGRFLRTTSIDELPQLWNVLIGDMSLVGPRPLPCSEAEGCEPWQRRRLDVMPGLTCIWQVRGRSAVSFADWVRMDVEYIESQSLGADFKLILQTVPAMMMRKGAH